MREHIQGPPDSGINTKRLVKADIRGREAYNYGNWFISKIGARYHATKSSDLDQYMHLKSPDLKSIMAQIDKADQELSRIGEGTSFPKWLLMRESVYDSHLLKAVVMLGGPGSGKSYMSGGLFKLGFRAVQSDMFFSMHLKKQGIPLKGLDIKSQKVKDLFNLAGQNNDNRLALMMKNMIPVVVESTGRNLSGSQWVKDTLNEHGYDVFGIFINLPVEVALARNKARGAKGDRQLVDDEVVNTHMSIQKNYQDGGFHKIFGKDKFFMVDSFAKDSMSKMAEIVKTITDAKLTNPIGQTILQNNVNTEYQRRLHTGDNKPGFPNHLLSPHGSPNHSPDSI